VQEQWATESPGSEGEFVGNDFGAENDLAAGALFAGPTPQQLSGPSCGVTLIAPRVAVTAAHCIYEMQQNGMPFFGMGIADGFGNHTLYAVRRAIPSGAYTRPLHDVGLIELYEAPPVTPMQIAAAAEGTYRFIGYGLPTGPTGAIPGSRKENTQEVIGQDDFTIVTRSIGGGLCWGDSGGPLFKNNQIVGVLADFFRDYSCFDGNTMVFTSLVAEGAFIQSAMQCFETGLC
jgi:hypothetical protein